MPPYPRFGQDSPSLIADPVIDQRVVDAVRNQMRKAVFQILVVFANTNDRYNVHQRSASLPKVELNVPSL
jgi:hypothetical protein